MAFGIIILFYVVITFASQNLPFLGDNITLCSKLASYYYFNGFAQLVPPLHLDTGHPPFWGVYMAACWQFWGRSLIVSHWVVFPFLLGTGYAFWQILKTLLPSSDWQIPLFFILLIEPAWITQASLAAIDIPLVCGYVTALMGILKRKPAWFAAGIGLMCMISLRGILLAGVLGVCLCLLLFFRLYQVGERGKKQVLIFLYLIATYLPIFVVVATWYAYRHIQTGFWILNHQSVWASEGHYGYTTPIEWFYNMACIGWRFLDQGRIAFWVLLGYAGIRFWQTDRRQLLLSDIPKSLPNTPNLFQANAALAEFTFITLFAAFLFASIVAARHNPLVPRYFISFFLCLIALSVVWFAQITAYNKFAKRIMVLCAVILLSGHAWIYPFPISNAWDTTWASLSFFSVKQEVVHYLKTQQIPQALVATTAPFYGNLDDTYLIQGENDRMDDYSLCPINEWQYILYSDFCNDFSPQQVQMLNNPQHWHQQKVWCRHGIRTVLYAKNDGV